jgi:D-alanine-D-alanine ligase-like ATP-grasp enzyme
MQELICDFQKINIYLLLEVNPNPDLTEGAGFMRSAEASGLSYTDTLKKIIELALGKEAENFG